MGPTLNDERIKISVWETLFSDLVGVVSMPPRVPFPHGFSTPQRRVLDGPLLGLRFCA